MILADSSYFIAITRENDRWYEDALMVSDKIKVKKINYIAI